MLKDVSDSEMALIDQFRKEFSPQLLSEKYNTDGNLLRWIRGYAGDGQLAMRKLRRHLQLRRALDLDNIIDNNPNAKLDRTSPIYAPTTIFSRKNKAADNKLVLFEFPGRVDIGGIKHAIRMSDFILSKYRMMEKIWAALNQNEKETNEISGVMFIFDMEGLVFDPSLLAMITGPFRILWGTIIEFYPEWICKFIVVNVSTFINVIWKVFMPFVPEHTKSKIVFTSDNWRKEILEYIDADYLPVHFGGNLKDENGDDMCRSKIRVPPRKIPQSLYWKPLPNEPTINQLNQLSISAGSKFFIAYEIETAHSSMELFFYCEHEHTFAIYFADHPKAINGVGNLEEVYLETERPGLPTTDRLTLACHRPGVYILKFGNEKAWILSLGVHYLLRFFDHSGHSFQAKILAQYENK